MPASSRQAPPYGADLPASGAAPEVSGLMVSSENRLNHFASNEVALTPNPYSRGGRRGGFAGPG